VAARRRLPNRGPFVSKIFDALRRADALNKGARASVELESERRERPYRVVAVTSNKGGVGKTTIAANLAVYLRALREEEPVLLFGFDDQTTLDRMFAFESGAPVETVADGFAAGSFGQVVRLGQYGVDFVPSSRDVPELKRRLHGALQLDQVLRTSDRSGFVVIDTKSDFEHLTQSAIDVADLTIVVVKDQASLHEARRVFDLLEQRGRPREAARVLLSLVDLRVKYRDEEELDVMAHLVSQIRREGYPLFGSFISRSPKVESLYTNPEGRAHSILHGASQSIVHRQMHQLTLEALALLEDASRPPVAVG